MTKIHNHTCPQSWGPDNINSSNESDKNKRVHKENGDGIPLYGGKTIKGGVCKYEQKIVPPRGDSPTVDELKAYIKEAVSTISNKSPAVLAILVMMYEAFNKSNQALADINAKMTKINEELMEGVAEEIKSKGRWDLAASAVNTAINAGVGIVGARMTHKASDKHTAANKMDASSNVSSAKAGITTDLTATGDTVKNTSAGQSGVGEIKTQNPISEPKTENIGAKEASSASVTAKQLKNSIDVTVDTPTGAELRAEATKLTATGQLLNTLSNIGVVGQLVSLGGKAEEAKQVIDQNYAQVALSLFQAGAADSDSNKKHVEAMLQTILNIIENIVQARDTAAQNC